MGMNSVLSFLWLHSCCVILAGYSLMEFTSVIKIFKLPNRVALLLHRLASLDSFATGLTGLTNRFSPLIDGSKLCLLVQIWFSYKM